MTVPPHSPQHEAGRRPEDEVTTDPADRDGRSTGRVPDGGAEPATDDHGGDAVTARGATAMSATSDVSGTTGMASVGGSTTGASSTGASSTGRSSRDGSDADEPGTDASGADGPGSHRAERPVPRSGLSEQHSATYLTGQRDAAVQEDPFTTVTPASGSDDASRDDDSRRPARRGADELRDDDEPDTAVILDGATTEPAPRKRTAAHLWGVLLTLVLVPVAWYLIADAGARLTLASGNQWDTGERNVAALIELGSGLLALAVALLAARWTSLGAIITGALVLLLGIPFVAVPTLTQDYLEPVTTWLRDFNDLGANLAHHLVASGSSGRLLAYGLALILVGVVSHGARRQGRREARAAVRLERQRAGHRD
ncbi:hypothetical protein [Georgenia wangjunii]|uniref:hypothetical protein n=1 Tax=Georgenia wangjunii TaxID=3117730 RepID=UPI002F265115